MCRLIFERDSLTAAEVSTNLLLVIKILCPVLLKILLHLIQTLLNTLSCQTLTLKVQPHMTPLEKQILY